MTTKPLAISISVTQVNRDLNLLCPAFADMLGAALRECRAAGLPVESFEAWRAPQRQAHLYAQGRTRDGKIVTDQGPWLSWHQYGLASDLVFRDAAGALSWIGPWDKVIAIVKAHGLESLTPFEQSHVQLTGGIPINDAQTIYQAFGLQQLWIEVLKRGSKAQKNA